MKKEIMLRVSDQEYELITSLAKRFEVSYNKMASNLILMGLASVNLLNDDGLFQLVSGLRQKIMDPSRAGKISPLNFEYDSLVKKIKEIGTIPEADLLIKKAKEVNTLSKIIVSKIRQFNSIVN